MDFDDPPRALLFRPTSTAAGLDFLGYPKDVIESMRSLSSFGLLAPGNMSPSVLGTELLGIPAPLLKPPADEPLLAKGPLLSFDPKSGFFWPSPAFPESFPPAFPRPGESFLT